MAEYKAEITVMPKDGVLDTQGRAVEKTLIAGGFGAVKDVRVGRYVRLALSAADEGEARAKVTAMCDDLLANELIESYAIGLEELS